MKFDVVFISISVLSFPLYGQEWTDSKPETTTSFVYAPGVLASEILMGRYCPTFVASTGQEVSCSKGIVVIRPPATSTNFAEISLRPVNKKELKKKKKMRRQQEGSKISIVGLFTAPLRAIWYTVSYISNFMFGYKISSPKVKNEAPKESLHMYSADFMKVNLGQEEDLKLFKKTYDRHLKSLQEHGFMQNRVILYGTSRGSATIFNFGALYHPEEVCAIVCEGLFDSIAHVYQVTRSARIRVMIKLLHKIGTFKDEGILPIKLIDKMPENMPILLITSHSDFVVPYECTFNMYSRLRQTCHHNVHILVLDKATHAWYPYCSRKERELYQNVVHAFYKHYGLPYIEEYAQEGADYFNTSTQPDF